MCHRLAPFVAATVIAGTAATAWAFWTTNAAAGSHGAATAATILQGATPSATLTSIGREVAISWGASTLSNGAPVDGYTVKRYPAGGGIGVISPIGTCSGTVASLGCAEDDVPPGAWKYAITPVLGSWKGAESLLSGIVSVVQTLQPRTHAHELSAGEKPVRRLALRYERQPSIDRRIARRTSGADAAVSPTSSRNG